MAYGYWGKLSEFVTRCDEPSFAEQLSANRVATGGYPLPLAEKSVWSKDGKTLAALFSELPLSFRENLFVACEYDIPGHLGRCDFVVVGPGRSGRLAVLIIELKSWKSFSASDLDSHVCILGENTIHPAIQVEHYHNRMELFHEFSGQSDVYSLVLMTELGISETSKLAQNGSYRAKIYSAVDQKSELINYLYEYFSDTENSSLTSRFIDGKCIGRAIFAQKLFERLPHITSGISAAISNSQALDLSDSQSNIVTTINNAANQKTKTLILIHGSPGSGKTVVGLHAVIHQLVENIDNETIGQRSLLALRNNRLCTVVRAALDDAWKPGLGKALVQYVKGGAQGIGLYYEVLEELKKHQKLPIYDLVVVDEAHRLPHEPNAILSQLDAVLSAGRTVVCLLDEGQSLNPDDNGNLEVLKTAWNRLFGGSKVVEYKLDEQYRLPPVYSAWIENFLAGYVSPFTDGYEIHLAERESDIISYLKEKAISGFSCGLLASYTKCNGRNGDDLRVPVLGVRWLMEPKDYNEWWRNKSVRHKFDRCASVYGCQGFELDYAGLFWGNDLCLTMLNEGNAQFSLCRQHDITDDIGQAYGKKLRTRASEAIMSADPQKIDQVISDLKNRYRILMTRAKKGLVIYCENTNTRKQLSSIIKYL